MPVSTSRLLLPALCLVASAAAGCGSSSKRAEAFGKIYYVDGAGNLGYGSAVPGGFRAAGYKGDVETFLWTTSFNPLLDQLNILGIAEGAGKRLARKIQSYKQEFPNNRVDIVALSAGTGVAVWACENLEGPGSVDNLVLLGSSLSHDYDVTRALRHVKQKVYVYHSPHDAVLQAVEVVGTIDRKTGKSAGQVGLKPRGGDSSKIVNIPWSTRWRSLGWNGGHTDCTNPMFIQREVAKQILTPADLATAAAGSAHQSSSAK